MVPDFAQVVTQTRHLLDTELVVDGEVARRWMLHAQCFAGAAEPPPTPVKKPDIGKAVEWIGKANTIEEAEQRGKVAASKFEDAADIVQVEMAVVAYKEAATSGA